MRPPGDPGVSVKAASRSGGDGDPFSVKAGSCLSLPRPRNSLCSSFGLCLPGGPRQTLISQMHSHDDPGFALRASRQVSSCSSLHRPPEAANCKSPAFSPELGSVRRAQRPPAPQQLLQSGGGQEDGRYRELSGKVVVTPLRGGACKLGPSSEERWAGVRKGM